MIVALARPMYVSKVTEMLHDIKIMIVAHNFFYALVKVHELT